MNVYWYMIYLILNKYSSFIHLLIVHLFLPSKNSFWWSRLEDILKTPFVFNFKGRLQDVFKTSWSRRIYPPLSNVFRRRLQDVFNTSSRLLAKTSWRCFAETSSRHLQNVVRSSKRLQDVLQRCLQDTSIRIIK